MKVRLLAFVSATALIVLVAPGAADALPITRSRPYQAVCAAQGGTFSVATDARSLYCDKEGALFTAFTTAELGKLRRTCERLYRGFFGVQGFVVDGRTGTGTFCATV
jgi:hypothetical protein